MKKNLNLRFGIISVILAVLLLEGISSLILLGLDRWPTNSFPVQYRDYLEDFKFTKWSDPPAKKYAAHPYFGYYHQEKMGVDLEKFDGLSKSKDEYWVGLFGGSFALEWGQSIEADASTYFNKLNGAKKIRFLNFSMAGSKQPQTFAMLSHFFKKLDYVIVLDGFNEVFSSPKGFPQHYPLHSEILYPKKWDFLSQVGELYFWRKLSLLVTSLLDKLFWPINRSPTLYLVWDFFYHQTQVNVYQKELELQQAIGQTYQLDARKNGKKLELWSHFTLMGHRLLKSFDKPYLFVLQPNQHDQNSKPLSLTESEKFTQKNWVSPVSDWYQLIEDEGLRLERLGIRFKSARKVFKKRKENLYRDNCCHLNQEGLKLFGKWLKKEL